MEQIQQDLPTNEDINVSPKPVSKFRLKKSEKHMLSLPQLKPLQKNMIEEDDEDEGSIECPTVTKNMHNPLKSASLIDLPSKKVLSSIVRTDRDLGDMRDTKLSLPTINNSTVYSKESISTLSTLAGPTNTMGSSSRYR